METIEIVGDSVEEAVATGIKELGVSPSDVMVEVLEEPSRGLFGIGARPAKVRLRLIGGKRATPSPAVEIPASHSAVETTTEPESTPLDYVDEEELDEDARVSRQVLGELMEKMGIHGDVQVRRADPSREGEDAPWVLNIAGGNARQLIGRRGETLAALQYIVRLIISKRLEHRSDVIVDVAEYKSERFDRLKGLANRMADQAVKQKRTITLEPMPPNERRIIHLTLRERKDVETRSVGEGTSRKVTIVPAK